MVDYSLPDGECPFNECLVSGLETQIAALKELMGEMINIVKDPMLNFEKAYVNEGSEIDEVFPVCDYCKGIGVDQGGPKTIIHMGSCIVGRINKILNRPEVKAIVEEK